SAGGGGPGGRRGRVPDERDAEAEPAVVLVVGLRGEAPHPRLGRRPRRGAVGYPAAAGGADEGLDQRRVVRDPLGFTVEIRVGHAGEVAGGRTRPHDVELLGRRRGGRLHLDPGLGGGRRGRGQGQRGTG